MANMVFNTIANYNSRYFIDAIQIPATFEQLRTTPAGNKLRILVEHLILHVTHPALVNALMSVLFQLTKNRLLINLQDFEMALLHPGNR